MPLMGLLASSPQLTEGLENDRMTAKDNLAFTRNKSRKVRTYIGYFKAMLIRRVLPFLNKILEE